MLTWAMFFAAMDNPLFDAVTAVWFVGIVITALFIPSRKTKEQKVRLGNWAAVMLFFWFWVVVLTPIFLAATPIPRSTYPADSERAR